MRFSRSLDRIEVLYNGLSDESSSPSLSAFNYGFTTTYFSESGNTSGYNISQKCIQTYSFEIEYMMLRVCEINFYEKGTT